MTRLIMDRRLLRRLTLPLLLAAALILTLGRHHSAYSQSQGAVIRVASGYPSEIPADNESETMLEVDISGCTFGGTADPNGQYSITASASRGRLTPTFASTLEGDKFPPLLLLESTRSPGESLIQVTISYCPQDALFILGVCSAPGAVEYECKGSMIFTFTEEEPETTSTDGSYWDSPEHATEEALHHSTEEAAAQTTTEAHPDTTSEAVAWATDEAHHHNEDNQLLATADLYQELSDYLAGEGITAPTPGQIGASGAALATLLAGWLILNQISGVSAQTSLEVIDAWSHNQPPPEPPESTLQEQQVEPEQDLPPDQQAEQTEEQPDEAEPEPASLQAPDSVPEQDELQPPGPPQDTGPLAEHPEPKPPLPGAEDQALQHIRDAQDLDDAVKNTRRDFETFYNNVPESVRNSAFWQNNVTDKYEQIRDMAAQGELDRSRTWLDRAEQLLQLRNEIERDLNHLPQDSVEAIVWTERTLQALGHFTTDAYQALVTNPAREAGSAVLPFELSQQWNNALDELDQDLANVAQDVSRLPRQGAEMLTHRNLQQQAQEMLQSSEQSTREMGQEIRELYGERDVPVEYPDFMGRGTRKVQELWDHTMNSLFGGN